MDKRAFIRLLMGLLKSNLKRNPDPLKTQYNPILQCVDTIDSQAILVIQLVQKKYVVIIMKNVLFMMRNLMLCIPLKLCYNCARF